MDHTEKDPKQAATKNPGEDSTMTSDVLLDPSDSLSKENITEMTTQQIEAIEAETTLPSGFRPSFPLGFEFKWPLTRAERVQELEEILSRHYFKTPQKNNIKAAIAYHAGFPPDEMIPDEHICFQDGKAMKE
ncbi:hypothetical protein PISL3812_01054 [Talaromyces islandicus]|uniref:Uncharacterized protein n=1 Tax=Talaromyces islandicus TaxID=28573 RepID=A0A0U1LKZ1_TALIS|nr:hypothetical protein PISL3812_01054 [Talaromyces islandicus]